MSPILGSGERFKKKFFFLPPHQKNPQNHSAISLWHSCHSADWKLLVQDYQGILQQFRNILYSILLSLDSVFIFLLANKNCRLCIGHKTIYHLCNVTHGCTDGLINSRALLNRWVLHSSFVNLAHTSSYLLILSSKMTHSFESLECFLGKLFLTESHNPPARASL